MAAFGSTQVTFAEKDLREALEDLAYDLLDDMHGGWENDDGAYGEFTFDCADRSITLDFNERYTESTNYTHQF